MALRDPGVGLTQQAMNRENIRIETLGKNS